MDKDLLLFNYGLFAKGLELQEIGRRTKTLIANHKTGFSFLFNPVRLERDRISSDLEKGQYLYLAAKRNYAEFVLYGDSTLKVGWLGKSFDLTGFKNNRLLNIENGRIHFRHEEQ